MTVAAKHAAEPGGKGKAGRPAEDWQYVYQEARAAQEASAEAARTAKRHTVCSRPLYPSE